MRGFIDYMKGAIVGDISNKDWEEGSYGDTSNIVPNVFKLLVCDYPPILIDGEPLTEKFKIGFPLLTKISEKVWFKNFLFKNFKADLNISIHPTNESNDNPNLELDINKLYENVDEHCRKVIYYTVDVKLLNDRDSKDSKFPEIDIVYIRKTDDSTSDFSQKFKDHRDKQTLIFEYLLENVQEAFTVDKSQRGYDNSFLEFLGDGVISIFVVWDLVLKFSLGNLDTDIDTQRIQTTSLKKLYNIGVHPKYNLFEFLIAPQHKVLEFFILPILKLSPFLTIKFFEKYKKYEKLLEKINEDIDVGNIKLNNFTQTQLKEEEVQRQVKMKKKEEEDDFADMWAPGEEDEDEVKQNDNDDQHIAENKDYNEFVCELARVYFLDYEEFILSIEKRKELSKYFKSVEAD